MIQKNCTKCEYKNTCKSYYGAKGCKFEKEIVNAILNDKKVNEKDIGKGN